MRWYSFLLYKWPPGLSTRTLPLHRMSSELCSDYMNVLGLGGGERPPSWASVCGDSVGAERGFIFVLILVRDYSIYLFR